MSDVVVGRTAVHVRQRSRYLCTVPKITAILDVAGIDHGQLIIAKRPGADGVFISPFLPASWNADDRQKIITALFTMGLHVHVLATDSRGRGGHVEFRVVPGGWLG